MAIETGSALFKCFLWVADKFGSEFIKGSAQKITKAAKSQLLKRAAKIYEDEMRELYGTIRVFGMVEPMSLKGIYTYVNVLKPGSIRRTSPDQLKQMYLECKGFGDAEEKCKTAMSAVESNEKLFVLGKPGAGKTTLLKNITMSALDGTLSLIPIFIQLKPFSESDLSITEYIKKQFEICNFPDAESFINIILQNGKAVVLFDGLDEVSEDNNIRTIIIQELVDFSNKFRKNKIVISCRVAATDYSFEKFTYIEIADFNDEQINIFARKWFKSNKVLAKRFHEKFKENTRLKDIARTPLLLTLLCISFAETGTFPTRITEIYEEAIDALLKKWDVSRNIFRDEKYRFLPLARKRQMFEYIAAVTFEKQEFILSREQLESHIKDYLIKLPNIEDINNIDSSGVLKSIEAQHGIFIERSKNLYTFAHLTFQEYFTAQYLTNRYANISILDLAKSFVDGGRWHQVIRLYLEIENEADEFITEATREIRERCTVFGGMGEVSRKRAASTIEEVGFQWLEDIEVCIGLMMPLIITSIEEYEHMNEQDSEDVKGYLIEEMEYYYSMQKEGMAVSGDRTGQDSISRRLAYQRDMVRQVHGILLRTMSWRALYDQHIVIYDLPRLSDGIDAVCVLFDGLKEACISDKLGTFQNIARLI